MQQSTSSSTPSSKLLGKHSLSTHNAQHTQSSPLSTQDLIKRSRVTPVQQRGKDQPKRLIGRVISYFAGPNFDNLLQNAVVKSVDPQKVKHYFDLGGKHDVTDSSRNTLPHLLIKQHGHWQVTEKDKLQTLQHTAHTIMEYYQPEEIHTLANQTNLQGNTAWQELILHAQTRPEARQLSPTGRIIAKELLLAGASPLEAVTVRTPADFPAVALLPLIQQDEELLSLIINADPDLILRASTSSNSALSNPAITAKNPTLVFAAINLRLPGTLNLLIKLGATFHSATSPAIALSRLLPHWHEELRLRECGKVVRDQAIQIEDGQLEGRLQDTLNCWERSLQAADTVQKDAISQSLELLFDLMPTPDIPLRVKTRHEPEFVISSGLRAFLQSGYPNLWSIARNFLE